MEHALYNILIIMHLCHLQLSRQKNEFILRFCVVCVNFCEETYASSDQMPSNSGEISSLNFAISFFKFSF